MSQDKQTPLLLKIDDITEEEVGGSWSAPAALFEEQVHPLPVAGAAELEGSLYRIRTAVHFSGVVRATLELECSRCLESFGHRVESGFSVVFVPRREINPEESETELSADELDVQFYDDDEIDLFPPTRDQVALAAPMRPLCSEECKGLCSQCGANLNETSCGCETHVADPRFAVLKKLIKNQE